MDLCYYPNTFPPANEQGIKAYFTQVMQKLIVLKKTIKIIKKTFHLFHHKIPKILPLAYMYVDLGQSRNVQN